MSEYFVFSEVSSAILKLLRTKLCPEPIVSPSMIEIASPLGKNADYTLGIYLYDLHESGEITEMTRISIDEHTQQMPPKVYYLYYLIYINQESQAGVKEVDMHKILGRVAQVMSDNGILEMPKSQKNIIVEPPVQITAAKLTMEEKTKIWTAVNKPYSLCLAYKAYPVYISSERTITSTRVVDASIHLRQRGN